MKRCYDLRWELAGTVCSSNVAVGSGTDGGTDGPRNGCRRLAGVESLGLVRHVARRQREPLRVS